MSCSICQGGQKFRKTALRNTRTLPYYTKKSARIFFMAQKNATSSGAREKCRQAHSAKSPTVNNSLPDKRIINNKKKPAIMSADSRVPFFQRPYQNNNAWATFCQSLAQRGKEVAPPPRRGQFFRAAQYAALLRKQSRFVAGFIVRDKTPLSMTKSAPIRLFLFCLAKRKR